MGTAGFLQTEKSRDEFKQAIRELAQKSVGNRQLDTPDPINNSKNFPLLVIIDELDRCRPDYAITLLESIKHLFNEPGIVFLISMDAEQILSVIEHTFGLHERIPGTNSNIRQNYLRKFIDIFWALPDPDARFFVLQNLLSRQPAIPKDWPKIRRGNFNPSMEIPDAYPLLSRNSFYYILACAAIDKQKSLRELLQILEKFFIISSCYQLTTRESLVILDILMKCTNETKNQDISDIIVQKKFSPEPVRIKKISFLKSPETRHIIDNDLFMTIYLLVIENSQKQISIKLGPSDTASNGVPTYSAIDVVICSYLEKIFTPFSGKELLQSVTQKISFLDSFHFGE